MMKVNPSVRAAQMSRREGAYACTKRDKLGPVATVPESVFALRKIKAWPATSHQSRAKVAPRIGCR